jgi:hypothetical protein
MFQNLKNLKIEGIHVNMLTMNSHVRGRQNANFDLPEHAKNLSMRVKKVVLRLIYIVVMCAKNLLQRLMTCFHTVIAISYVARNLFVKIRWWKKRPYCSFCV